MADDTTNPGDRPGASLTPDRAGPSVVAAFDFYGTLTTGGSVLRFLVAVRGVPAVARAVALLLPQLTRGAVAGGAAADRAKEMLFTRLLAGLAREDVWERAERFAEQHVTRAIRPEVRARLDWHRRLGHRVVIVSESPECYVIPAAAVLGADGAIGTRLAVDPGGRLTGRYAGKNCRGTEKYIRVMGWIRSSSNGSDGGAGPPVLWAYGNSRGDLPLLQAAEHGVNAGRLGRFGRLRHLTRLVDLSPVGPSARRREPIG
jgi:HAD superfamily hydrolase (TIGR01490 family)